MGLRGTKLPSNDGRNSLTLQEDLFVATEPGLTTFEVRFQIVQNALVTKTGSHSVGQRLEATKTGGTQTTARDIRL